MKRTLQAILFFFLAIAAASAQTQLPQGDPYFIGSLPFASVVGRMPNGPGPAEAIPFSLLGGLIGTAQGLPGITPNVILSGQPGLVEPANTSWLIYKNDPDTALTPNLYVIKDVGAPVGFASYNPLDISPTIASWTNVDATNAQDQWGVVSQLNVVNAASYLCAGGGVCSDVAFAGTIYHSGSGTYGPSTWIGVAQSVDLSGVVDPTYEQIDWEFDYGAIGTFNAGTDAHAKRIANQIVCGGGTGTHCGHGIVIQTYSAAGQYPIIDTGLDFTGQFGVGIDTSFGYFSLPQVRLAEQFNGTVTFTNGTPGVVNWTGSSLPVNTAVVFSGGTPPTGITLGGVYYVVSPGANSFNVSTTLGGSAVAFSGSPSGTTTALTGSVGVAFGTMSEGGSVSSIASTLGGQIQFANGVTQEFCCGGSIGAATAEFTVTAYGTQTEAISPNAGGVTTLVPQGGSSYDMSTVIVAALGAGSSVRLTCGSFYVSNAVLLPSNSDLGGSGPCTQLISTSSLVHNPQWTAVGATAVYDIISNNAFIAGNSNIHLHDMSVLIQSPPGNETIANFYNTTGVTVDHLYCVGDGSSSSADCTEFEASSYYIVSHNIASGLANACYDQFAGSSNFTIADNVCNGTISLTRYGVIVNGIASIPGGAYTAETSHDFTVTGNQISNILDYGIYVGGLSASSVNGLIRGAVVTGNTIASVGDWCILITNGSDVVASGNHCYNPGQYGIVVESVPSATNTINHVILANNTVSNASSSSSGTYDAIYVGITASDVSIDNNTIIGTTHRWAVNVAAANTLISIKETTNQLAAGAAGQINDLSTTPTDIVVGPYNNYFDGYPEPFVLGGCHVPMIIPSSGTMGTTGNISGITALQDTYSNGAWLLLPVNAINSGSAEHWYWFVGSSATAGTVYNSTLLLNDGGGPPTCSRGTATAFSSTTSGTWTQVTGDTTAWDFEVPANMLGVNGSIRLEGHVSFNDTANAHNIKGIFGSWTFALATNISDNRNGFAGGFSNAGETGVQTQYLNGATFNYSACSTCTPSYGANDTTAQQLLNIDMNDPTATDTIVLEDLNVIFYPGH